MTWILLAAAIALEVASSLALSAATTRPGWFVVVVIGSVGSFVLLPLILRRGLPLGVTYGIWGASGVALTAVLGAVLLGDPLTPLTVVGLVLIVGGVVTIELGRQRAERAAPGRTGA